jgi:hypothetical protein
MKMVEHALELAERGLAVFPLKPKSKTPWCRGGCLAATTDAETLLGWWDGWADSNIGIATGSRSGIWVLDIDGELGAESLRALESRFGKLPPAVTAITGSGGSHYYFSLPSFDDAPKVKNTVGAIAAGIDTRGEGGYAAAPPSLHPNGNRYRWAPTSAHEFNEAPVWLIGLLTAPTVVTALDARRGPTHWTRIIQSTVAEGTRNQTTASLAGKLLRSGLTPSDTLALLLGWNDRTCRPPLPQREVEAIIISIHKREAKRRQREELPT